MGGGRTLSSSGVFFQRVFQARGRVRLTHHQHLPLSRTVVDAVQRGTVQVRPVNGPGSAGVATVSCLPVLWQGRGGFCMRQCGVSAKTLGELLPQVASTAPRHARLAGVGLLDPPISGLLEGCTDQMRNQTVQRFPNHHKSPGISEPSGGRFAALRWPV